MEHRILVGSTKDSIDAFVLARELIVPMVSSRSGIDPYETAVIASELSDLAMLEVEDIAFIATTTNGTKSARETVAKVQYGSLQERAGILGFKDFYEMCRTDGIKLVIAARRGVLQFKNTVSEMTELKRLVKMAGVDASPAIAIVTNAGLSELGKYLKEIGAPAKTDRDLLIFAEAGAVQLERAKFGEFKAISTLSDVQQQAAALLNGSIREALTAEIADSVLPDFGFRWTAKPDSLSDLVFVPAKESMLTIGIPQQRRGKAFRGTDAAGEFINAIANVMVRVVIQHGLRCSRV